MTCANIQANIQALIAKSKSISDVNVDSAALIFQVMISKSFISGNKLFEWFWTVLIHILQTRRDLEKYFEDLLRQYGSSHLVPISCFMVNNHCQERRYKCNKGQKSSEQPNHLISHLMIHSGAKPYCNHF